MLTKKERTEIEKLAYEIRIGIVEAISSLGQGHIGGSLSIADVLAVLYGKVMNIDPKNPAMEDRDMLVCSKGHAGPAVYSTLAAKGFIDREELKTLNKPGTRLPSHCDRLKTPGIDMTTGSLGQGTSLACGLAYGKMLKGQSSRVFLIVGDGEANEGQVWEAAMFTAAKKVKNIVWLIDDNKRQLDGWTKDINESFDFEEKFRAFGFDAIRVNGHDYDELYAALTREAIDKPIAIILDTVKGKGIKEVEETVANHSMPVNQETGEKWISALREEMKALD